MFAAVKHFRDFKPQNLIRFYFLKLHGIIYNFLFAGQHHSSENKIQLHFIHLIYSPLFAITCCRLSGCSSTSFFGGFYVKDFQRTFESGFH